MPVAQAQSDVVQTEGLGGTAPILFLCEHASNHFPEKFGNFGLSDDIRKSHVAWDPHALEITRRLATRFFAPFVAGGVSRLIYDNNRPTDVADAIPETSEVFDIPGNRGLSAEDRARRITEVYKPFCAAVDHAIDTAQTQAIVTIHTFTPVYFGQSRSGEIGLLHDADTRLCDAMLAAADQTDGYAVRQNDPYGPEHGVTHSLKIHAMSRGLLNVMIEVRNDLMDDEENMQKICDCLGDLLEAGLSANGVVQTTGGT